MAEDVVHAYRYRFASRLERTSAGLAVRLAASAATDKVEQPGDFFEGRVLEPRRLSEMLLALSAVVAWEVPRPVALDPVVTSSEEVLRFEAFSPECSMHARVDVRADGFELTSSGRGTTNVDFNRPMRTALARVRDADETRLAIGRHAVTLARGKERIVEKKVALPTKWLRGFCEVQAHQRRLVRKIDVGAEEGLAFLRSLPRQPPKRPWFVTEEGGELQSGLRESERAVSLRALERLRLLEPVLRSPGGRGARLRIWADGDGDTTLWEIVDGPRRFSLLLGGDRYRGLSAGGGALSELSDPRALDAIARVRAQLHWQSRLEPSALAREAKIPIASIEAALAVLGAQGLAGFDPDAGHWFHRELPFDLGTIDRIHPRLAGARRLLEEGLVKEVSREGPDAVDYEVQGTDVAHYVRLRPDGDRCSCTWFRTHEGRLGPCKHVLAARSGVRVVTASTAGKEKKERA